MILSIQQEGSQQPQAPPRVQPQPQPYPQYPQYPPEVQAQGPPPAPPKSNLWTIILIVFTVVVVTIIILAMIFYLITIGHPCCGSTEPQINLSVGSPTGVPGEWRIEVAGASSGEALANYNVVLLNGTHVAVPSTSLDTMGSSCYGLPGIAFQDLTNNSKLDLGDWFIVCGTDTVSDYQVQIFWKASNNKVTWDTGKIEQ